MALHAKKGVIFSLDALLAIIAATTLIIASFFYISQIQILQWTQPHIYIVNLDSLTTMRDSGTLQGAVASSDYGDIQEFLDSIVPQNICSSIEIYDSIDSKLASINKTGCEGFANEIYISRRTFIESGNVYYATMKSRFK